MQKDQCQPSIWRLLSFLSDSSWPAGEFCTFRTYFTTNEKELTKKICKAQKADPLKGDYCKLVESDMNMIDLKLIEQEITNMSRFEFKTVVRRRTREAVIKYLEEIKETKSKIDGIEYTVSFDLQPYLLSYLFTREESSLLLALRTRCVRGVRSDFGKMYPDKNCPLPGCTEEDSLPHILVCSALSPVQGQTALYSTLICSPTVNSFSGQQRHCTASCWLRGRGCWSQTRSD